MHKELIMQKVLFKQKLILIPLGVILALFILEIGLRIGGSMLLFLQERRNVQSIKKKGEYRIMCLGESTTYEGFDYEDSYPFQLEDILNKAQIGIKFTVINKGGPGQGVESIARQLEKNIDRYSPDMVITMMGINDDDINISYDRDTTSKPIRFLKSFRVYKLTRLLWLHTKMRTKEAYDRQTDVTQGEGMLTTEMNLDLHNDSRYVELGNRYSERGMYTEAEEMFKKALEFTPKNVRAYIGLGWCHASQFDFNACVDYFKKALEVSADNDEIYFGLGSCFRREGDFVQAEENFKKAIELNPRNDEAYHHLGWIYKQQKKFTQAEIALNKAIEINDKNSNTYFELGSFYWDQNEFMKAEMFFRKARELSPHQDFISGSLVTLYRERGDYKIAEDYYRQKMSFKRSHYNPVVHRNYLKVKDIVDKRRIKLVCVQYPMRSINLLKRIFKENGEEGIIFVDNESVFKNAVKKSSYKEYFKDIFAGDFGHCTPRGNRLLAENVAQTILRECFNNYRSGEEIGFSEIDNIF